VGAEQVSSERRGRNHREHEQRQLPTVEGKEEQFLVFA
jgi:hypothetical protein